MNLGHGGLVLFLLEVFIVTSPELLRGYRATRPLFRHV